MTLPASSWSPPVWLEKPTFVAPFFLQTFASVFALWLQPPGPSVISWSPAASGILLSSLLAPSIFSRTPPLWPCSWRSSQPPLASISLLSVPIFPHTGPLTPLKALELLTLPWLHSQDSFASVLSTFVFWTPWWTSSFARSLAIWWSGSELLRGTWLSPLGWIAPVFLPLPALCWCKRPSNLR